MSNKIIVGNPMIYSQGNNLYGVIYALPPKWEIKNLENLTYAELTKLPFVDKQTLQLLK